MSTSMRNNPWADPKETQRWVQRKVAESGTRLPHLSTSEWVTTIIVSFIISVELYCERAIMIVALISTADQFGWNTLAEVTLIAVWFLGYFCAQIPSGYLSDHRLDVIASLTGVDQISGEVVLNSPIEQHLGIVFFTNEPGNSRKVEADYGEVQLDSLMQPSDVVTDGGTKPVGSKTNRKWKRLKHLRRQLGLQYSKYGSRWLVTLAFIVWGLTTLLFGVLININSEPSLIYLFLGLRFLSGLCDGIIVVSIQGLIAKEVPPAVRVSASSIIGIAMPIGFMCGTLVRYSYLAGVSVKQKAHVDAITWLGASALIFSIVVFIWLSGAIDESFDQQDLLEHKHEIQNFKDKNKGNYNDSSDRGSTEELRSTSRGCFRGATRLLIFSWMEMIWMHRFRGLTAIGLSSFTWSFAVFSMTSWLPSAIHGHYNILQELRLHIENYSASAVNLDDADVIPEKENFPLKSLESTKLAKLIQSERARLALKKKDTDDSSEVEALNLLKAVESNDDVEEDAAVQDDQDGAEEARVGMFDFLNFGDEEEMTDTTAVPSRDTPGIDSAEILRLKEAGILSEEEAGKALLKLLEVNGRRRSLSAINESHSRELELMRMKAISDSDIAAIAAEYNLSNREIVSSEDDVDAETFLDSVGMKKNLDGSYEMEDEQQIMIWGGMAIAALFSMILYYYLTLSGGMGVKLGWGISTCIGTIIPGVLFIYVALNLGTSSNASVKDYHDEMHQNLFALTTALILMGLVIPPLVSAQNLVAPFKAGASYSLISTWSAGGVFAALLTSLFGPAFCSGFGLIYFEMICWLAAISSLMTFIFFCFANFALIPELCPTDMEGEKSKRVKYMKPVEMEEDDAEVVIA